MRSTCSCSTWAARHHHSRQHRSRRWRWERPRPALASLQWLCQLKLQHRQLTRRLVLSLALMRKHVPCVQVSSCAWWPGVVITPEHNNIILLITTLSYSWVHARPCAYVLLRVSWLGALEMAVGAAGTMQSYLDTALRLSLHSSGLVAAQLGCQLLFNQCSSCCSIQTITQSWLVLSTDSCHSYETCWCLALAHCTVMSHVLH